MDLRLQQGASACTSAGAGTPGVVGEAAQSELETLVVYGFVLGSCMCPWCMDVLGERLFKE